MDKLVFLGTGGDHIVVGKQLRNSGGIVLITEGMQFLIDPGPGCLLNAKNLGIHMRENTAILVTHSHVNHSNDLNATISATTHNGLDKKGVLFASKSVIEGNILQEHFKNCMEKIIIAEPGKKIAINKVEIDVFKCEHSEDSVGFKILCPKFTLAYSGDTEYYKGFEDNFKDIDIIILNVQEPFDKKEKGHLSADDVLKILTKVQPKLVVLTHFGSKMLAADPIEVTRQLEIKSKVNLMAAKDGMTLNPVTYSSGIRQKTLNIY